MSSIAVQVGDKAPDFSVPSHTGNTVSLAEYRGQKIVVLFFYPKDDSLICTKEACAFRDSYEDFVKAGAVVIGISGDSTNSHQGFAQRQRLPFLLISDADGSLRKAFGVPKTMGLLPGRVTYVIDTEGIVRLIINSALFAEKHVKEALDLVKKLAAKNCE